MGRRPPRVGAGAGAIAAVEPKAQNLLAHIDAHPDLSTTGARDEVLA